MKLERISDSQICCTITTQDLINNKIQLSELALGSEKARTFFQNLMIQANKELGFDGMNTPLMIEAIPQLPDCLKLIITKIDKNKAENVEFDDDQDIQIHGGENLINIFKKLRRSRGSETAKKSQSGTERKQGMPGIASQNTSMDQAFPISPMNDERLPIEAFRFETLENAVLAAKAIKTFFCGENNLFKETGQTSYLLTIHSEGESTDEFNRVCNIFSEYSVPVHCTASGEAYLKEHGCLIIGHSALQVLSRF